MRALLLASLLLLAACSREPIAGQVSDKYHRDGYTYVFVTTSCTMVGKTPVCTPQTHVQYIPEAWYLVVCNEDDCLHVSVREGTYDDFVVGEYFDEDDL